VKTSENSSVEAISKTHLRVGKPHQHPWSYSNGSFNPVMASLQGAPTRTSVKRDLLNTSMKILDLSMEVCISILIKH
jgi:hypothetical protein